MTSMMTEKERRASRRILKSVATNARERFALVKSAFNGLDRAPPTRTFDSPNRFLREALSTMVSDRKGTNLIPICTRR